MTTRFLLKASLLFVLCTLFSYLVFGQGYQPAIAYALPEITVDGQLNDWPANMTNYAISSVAFGDHQQPDDLVASFRTGYRAEEKAFYLAIEITDSDQVDTADGDVIDAVDHILLYLDPLHRARGGSRSLFLAGTTLRDFSNKAPVAWSPYTPNIGWDQVTHVAKHPTANTTVHEWRIDLGEYLEPGTVLGLDFIIADADRQENGNSWTTWRPRTSKSDGSQRLGEVYLAPAKNKLGTLRGKITSSESWINWIEHVRLVKTDNPALWFRVPVDSTGAYTCKVPAGTYEIVADHQLITPDRSENPQLPTLRIQAKQHTLATIVGGKPTTAPTLRLASAPLPGGLFEEQGVLFQKELSPLKLDRFIQTFQQYWEIPGVSVALLQNGEVVYNKTFGVKNTLTQEPLQPNSLFEGASTTKPTFALMVLKMAEEGKIDLDKPLYEYLRFPNLEHDERYKLITARHVLHHQTGLDNWPLGSYSGFTGDAPANLNFTPGTGYRYSGEAFNYLGRVVEHLTGKSVSQLFLEDLSPAMGMEASHFAYIDAIESEIATGHWENYPRYKNKFPGVDSPASSLHTSAHDFSSLLVSLYEQKYLSKESYELIYQPGQILTEEERFYDKEQQQGIAHGFFVSETPQGKRIEHGGNNGDFRCIFVLFPETGYGYAVFTNNHIGGEFARLLELYLLQGREGFDREFGKTK
ncbi:MAG: serine hydrolase [Bacteroidota bacterium]